MQLNFSSLSYQAHQSFRTNGVTISRAQVNEVLAALLGYGTYAAYHADDNNPAASDFTCAEHIVLQPEHAKARCETLGMDPDAISMAIHLASPLVKQSIALTGKQPSVHQSLEDFIDLFLRDFMEQEVVDSGEASSEMAATNGYLDMVEVDDIEPNEEFLKARGNWQIVGSGAIYMEQDQEKPFSGDTIKVTVTVNFDKTGRIGLTYAEREVSAGLDYTWGDEE